MFTYLPEILLPIQFILCPICPNDIFCFSPLKATQAIVVTPPQIFWQNSCHWIYCLTLSLISNLFGKKDFFKGSVKQMGVWLFLLIFLLPISPFCLKYLASISALFHLFHVSLQLFSPSSCSSPSPPSPPFPPHHLPLLLPLELSAPRHWSPLSLPPPAHPPPVFTLILHCNTNYSLLQLSNFFTFSFHFHNVSETFDIKPIDIQF